MKQQPLVSIILPVHNACTFLPHCLNSLLSQTYGNIEIIVIDDNSKDESLQILKQFKKLDKRIRVYKNKKRYGLAICFNRALKRAKGPFIAFMDSHDASSLDRIKRQVSFLLSHPKVVAVGTQFVFVNQNNKKTAKSELPQTHESIAKSLLTGISLQFETSMINQTLLPKDLLHFQENTYPFVYSQVFVKLLSYGELANLPWVLHQRRKLMDASFSLTTLPTHLKHLFKSVALHDYRPSFKSLFTPRIGQA